MYLYTILLPIPSLPYLVSGSHESPNFHASYFMKAVVSSRKNPSSNHIRHSCLSLPVQIVSEIYPTQKKQTNQPTNKQTKTPNTFLPCRSFWEDTIPTVSNSISPSWVLPFPPNLFSLSFHSLYYSFIGYMPYSSRFTHYSGHS